MVLWVVIDMAFKCHIPKNQKLLCNQVAVLVATLEKMSNGKELIKQGLIGIGKEDTLNDIVKVDLYFESIYSFEIIYRTATGYSHSLSAPNIYRLGAYLNLL